ncbi:hypothetical protein HJG60_008138 [Phyllostomus discolor]|uniref:Uncharacterized protein n=1 Tax=Phyllostomus discolor TaxID=89673 RepID=A0A834DSG0_9CHIR|nr:hypothetical protein HJG60_008138 [Phyllostomus discolor]
MGLFCTCQSVLVNPFTFVTQSPDTLPSGSHQPVSSASMSLFLFCLFIYVVLSIPQRGEIVYGICLSAAKLKARSPSLFLGTGVLALGRLGRDLKKAGFPIRLTCCCSEHPLCITDSQSRGPESQLGHGLVI